MPRDVRFYGASDDLFECEDRAGRFVDEVPVGHRKHGVYVIEDFGNVGMQVVATYAPDGIEDSGAGWVIGVAQLDEDAEIPDWPTRFTMHERGYSPVLTVTVPDTAKVRVAKGGED